MSELYCLQIWIKFLVTFCFGGLLVIQLAMPRYPVLELVDSRPFSAVAARTSSCFVSVHSVWDWEVPWIRYPSANTALKAGRVLLRNHENEIHTCNEKQRWQIASWHYCDFFADVKTINGTITAFHLVVQSMEFETFITYSKRIRSLLYCILLW